MSTLTVAEQNKEYKVERDKKIPVVGADPVVHYQVPILPGKNLWESKVKETGYLVSSCTSGYQVNAFAGYLASNER